MKNLTLLAFLLLICNSCKEDNQPTAPLAEPASEIISAENGGTIETEDRFSLEIPPGALIEDTEITLKPFFGNEMHEWCVSAVSLEPDGLTFDKPAKLSFPMPSTWPEDHNPLVLVAFGENSGDYFSMDVCAEVRSTENGLVAQIEIDHFSKYGAIGNCHKGTLVYLLKNFEQRGCSNADTWKKVTDKYGNINTNIDADPQTGHETLQALLGAYFQNNSSFEKDQLIGNNWNEIVDFVKNKNKRVVVLFAKDRWSSKTSKGFYNHVPHSTTLEIKDGKLKLRNSIAAKKDVTDAITEKNGENVFWYPDEDRDINAQDLENLRNSSPIDLLQSELSNRDDLFSNIPKRKNKPKPWTAIRFYVANQPDNINPCSEPSVEFDFNKVSFDIIVMGEYSYSFQSNTYLPAALNWAGNIQYNASEHKCYGNWDEDRGTDHHKGSIEIEFDPFTKAVTLFKASNERTNEYDEDYKYSIKSKIIDIKTTYDGDFREYKDFGTDVCQYIDTLKYTGGDEVTGFTLVNFSCQNDSYLNIYLSKE
jgi:hypothetical protein